LPEILRGVGATVQLGLGYEHGCALQPSGQIVLLGLQRLRPARTRDAAHGVAGPFLSLAVGDVHSCARHLNGIACWGRNANLQVGDGTAEDRARPVSAGGFRGLDL
jgi:hypothetical protein